MRLRLMPLLMALFFGLLAFPALAQKNAKPQIQRVIQSQIEAFEADDFETAFSFASP
ncbi:MAG: DUF4864 domain-containing protein, partial [Rhodobacterales bacterium]